MQYNPLVGETALWNNDDDDDDVIYCDVKVSIEITLHLFLFFFPGGRQTCWDGEEVVICSSQIWFTIEGLQLCQKPTS